MELLISEFTCTVIFLIYYPIFVDVKNYESSLSLRCFSCMSKVTLAMFECIILQVLGAYEDVFMSHSSWFVYQATMRIYKHYNFNVSDPATSAKRVSFSSYPGEESTLFQLIDSFDNLSTV